MQTELRNDNRYTVIFAAGCCNGSAEDTRIYCRDTCFRCRPEYLLNDVSIVYRELTQSAQTNACRVL
jgi:hypothetical protein